MLSPLGIDPAAKWPVTGEPVRAHSGGDGRSAAAFVEPRLFVGTSVTVSSRDAVALLGLFESGVLRRRRFSPKVVTDMPAVVSPVDVNDVAAGIDSLTLGSTNTSMAFNCSARAAFVWILFLYLSNIP